MQMVPQDRPPPRLLNTVVPDLPAAPAPTGRGSALGRTSLFSGNGLAIFVGVIIGGVLLAGAGWLHNRHLEAERAAAMAPVLVDASTGSVSSAEHELAPPTPIVVQLAAEHIRVTAIALGHPRLAVINGQQVAEGDYVTVHAPTARVELKLRIVRIADGQIELNDGWHTIIARLATPTPRPKAP